MKISIVHKLKSFTNIGFNFTVDQAMKIGSESAGGGGGCNEGLYSNCLLKVYK
jgi:hypothetical protein